MELSDYQALILKARTSGQQITDDSLRKIRYAFEKAYEDISRMLRDLDNDPRKTAQRQLWRMKKEYLKQVVLGLNNGYADALKEGMNLTAITASEIDRLAESMALGSVGKDTTIISQEFAKIPIAAVDAVWTRIGPDGLTLSKRIWNVSKHTYRRVDGIVLSGIARGQSAVNMAKELQQDILGIKSNLQIPESQRWTTGISKSVRGRGTIHYNALRLARTEIGNAYHEADIMGAMKSLVTGGVRWNLSIQHARYDVCLRKGTLIYTLRGYIPIEQVTKNDYVMTHNGRIRKVNKTYQSHFNGEYMVSLYYQDGHGLKRIVATPNHPIFTDNGVVAAIDVNCGFGKNAYVSQNKIYIHPAGEVVYNLGVEEDHSYIANGIAVHNCDILSSQDAYGLGSGVYPPEGVPLYPHPNDMCYTTRVIKPKSEWGKKRKPVNIKDDFTFKHPEETTYLDATRRVEVTEKITEHYADTVEAQFRAMMDNIVGARKFKGIEVEAD